MVQTNCPSCGYGRIWKLRRNKQKCKRCRKEFSNNKYPVSGFRLSVDDWVIIIKTFLRERTIVRVVEESGASQKTIQKAIHYIRLKINEEKPIIFDGPIEVDETYIGGQRKNKKLHIRRIATKRGHGTDKLPIVGLFDRSSGQVLVRVEPRKLDIFFISQLLRKHTKQETKIYTDGFKMYRTLTQRCFNHEYVDHDGGELVRGQIHTNNIEGFWGILKRKLGCIGGMRRDRLHLFVGEIVWRYNHRTLTIKEKEQALLELVFEK